MNVNNNQNTIVTKAPESFVQGTNNTANHSPFGCAKCINNSNETSSTCVRIGGCVATGAALGVLWGAGWSGLAVYLTGCKFSVLGGVLGGTLGGATGGGIAGVCAPIIHTALVNQDNQGAEPVITQPQKVDAASGKQPKTKRTGDSKGNYHAIAISDEMPLLWEVEL